jgi:hypothetical protein
MKYTHKIPSHILITLCRLCHWKEHGRFRLRRYVKKIVALRRKGYTFSELAGATNLKKSQVGYIVATEQKKDHSLWEDAWKNYSVDIYKTEKEKAFMRYVKNPIV